MLASNSDWFVAVFPSVVIGQSNCVFGFVFRHLLKPALYQLFSTAGSTIKTLLSDLDVLDKVTALLDLQESSWIHFGAKFKIDRKELDSLKPEPIRSPTKVLMECLVQKDPDLTMATFLKSLEKIERYDVIEELSRFFYRKISLF